MSIVILILFPCVLNYSAIADYLKRLQQPFVRARVDEVSTYIRSQSEILDQLWVHPGYNARYYVETGLTSPTRYHLIYPEWIRHSRMSSRSEKVARFVSELETAPPAWMVLCDDPTSLDTLSILD